MYNEFVGGTEGRSGQGIGFSVQLEIDQQLAVHWIEERVERRDEVTGSASIAHDYGDGAMCR
jgi:hypothetical protein